MTPIRPEQPSLYSGSPSSSPDSESSSPEWLKIRASILKRARDCCEGSVTYPACRVQHGQVHLFTGARVILMIAHVDHDPTNNAPENLRAWCQRCIRTHDRERG